MYDLTRYYAPGGRARPLDPQGPAAGRGTPFEEPDRHDELEKNPATYAGERISVAGEIQNVIGPRTFTIDERNWIDLDGETLVVVPAPLSVMIREDQPVRVTGVVTPYVEAQIERDWGWFDNPDLETALQDRAVIVADTVTTPAGATVIDHAELRADAFGPPSDSRAASFEAPVTDVRLLAASNDTRLVGRQARFENVVVSAQAEDGRGFWLGESDQRLYVLPADRSAIPEAGDRVAVHGPILRLPRNMQERVGDATGEESLYVYARTIERRASAGQGR